MQMQAFFYDLMPRRTIILLTLIEQFQKTIFYCLGQTTSRSWMAWSFRRLRLGAEPPQTQNGHSGLINQR